MNHTKQKLAYDVIRIIGCALVVLVHVSGSVYENSRPGSSDFMIGNMYNVMGIVGVPLFVMLSGALLLNSGKEIRTGTFLRKHCLKILLLYLLTLFCYNLWHYCRGEVTDIAGRLQTCEEYSFGTFKEYVMIRTLSCVGIGCGHLWYLPMILALYLLTPLMRRAFDDRKACRYYLVIFCAVGVLWNTVLQFDIPYKRIVSSFRDTFDLGAFCGYAGFYVLGHYITEYSSKPGRRGMIAAGLGIPAGIGLTACLDYARSMDTGRAVSTFNNPTMLGGFLAAGCTFYLLYHLIGARKSNAKTAAVSGLTLGIYLIHPAVIDLLEQWGLCVTDAPSAIGIPVFAVLVFVVSAIPVALIRLSLHGIYCLSHTSARSSGGDQAS